MKSKLHFPFRAHVIEFSYNEVGQCINHFVARALWRDQSTVTTKTNKFTWDTKRLGSRHGELQRECVSEGLPDLKWKITEIKIEIPC